MKNTTETKDKSSRKPSSADSEDLEYHNSQDSFHDSQSDKNEYNSIKNLIEVLKKGHSSSDSFNSEMKTTIVVDEANKQKKRKPSKKTSAYKTLLLSSNVIAKLLDFGTNDYSNNPTPSMNPNKTGGVVNAQSGGELSTFSLGNVPTPPAIRLAANFIPVVKNDKSNRTRINSDPRIRVDVSNRDIPSSIAKNILKYNSHTSKPDKKGQI